jgi:coenzyme F420-0:L-glutamate ligase/coenzyme F420-1:gamma-L-glutamate ligase
MKLELFAIPGLPEFQRGDNLGAILLEHAQRAGIEIHGQDIAAVAQKVVSKVEGRVVHLDEVNPSARAVGLARLTGKDPRLVETILRDSRRIVRCRGDVLICETHHGFICANAGVDRSNVDGGDTVTLLPVNPDYSAARLARQLGCGVMITDTFGRAWREGLVDTVIGLARVPPFLDFRGTSDSRGYSLQASILAAVDGLAAAAGVLMGKSSQTPAIVIRGYVWTPEDSSAQVLLRSKNKDLFL